MRICRVQRPVVATIRVRGLGGVALLLVREETGEDGSPGPSLVAADLVGAGVGQRVLVATGGAARQDERMRDVPADAAVVAILDT